MLGDNIRPDDHIFPSATKSCAILGRFDIGQSMHCLVLKTGYDMDVFVASSLVDMYGEFEEALALFKQALYERLDVNDFTFSSVVQVCANSTLLQLGAYRVFDEASVKNLGMWNAMLIACAQHSHTEKAFDLFKRMEVLEVKPNFITFLCVLYACSHAGLVERGKRYFELMKKYRIEPGDQHYASLVDLFDRSGKLQEALSIIREMLIWPTESVWIFELGPVSSGLHVLLCNPYVAVSRYEDAVKARKMLRDRGIKKETGLSWVEEGNKVHTFAVGDRSHAKTKDIYQKLEELGDKMERAGYIAETSFVLRAINGEEKNQTIRYHSERLYLERNLVPEQLKDYNRVKARLRLAVAFGLLAFPPDRAIRVMKNLRICGDCHTAIKFMSKCTGRVIIVRDNNRFHLFEDGKCSCGDYW
ncbi:putative pentatricopeptide repeat-containing protein [Hibiscus syriacus]|uniref:Pentatricopeptide repeat-containing protein n=1 Tax=Hibiscus syriacus TaxID=106335 RepID=A0A6A3CYC7_HIBSY|nr:putative pentatricopeptide repeat-containing protein [Hibiscus syriacus]